jgi:hypothetical protein
MIYSCATASFGFTATFGESNRLLQPFNEVIFIRGELPSPRRRSLKILVVYILKTPRSTRVSTSSLPGMHKVGSSLEYMHKAPHYRYYWVPQTKYPYPIHICPSVGCRKTVVLSHSSPQSQLLKRTLEGVSARTEQTKNVSRGHTFVKSPKSESKKYLKIPQAAAQKNKVVLEEVEIGKIKRFCSKYP